MGPCACLQDTCISTEQLLRSPARPGGGGAQHHSRSGVGPLCRASGTAECCTPRQPLPGPTLHPPRRSFSYYGLFQAGSLRVRSGVPAVLPSGSAPTLELGPVPQPSASGHVLAMLERVDCTWLWPRAPSAFPASCGSEDQLS